MLRLSLALLCTIEAVARSLRSQNAHFGEVAPPSWLAVGPSATPGSFDLFNLASNGAKTKVLVTFPVDAAEVAQDGGEIRVVEYEYPENATPS